MWLYILAFVTTVLLISFLNSPNGKGIVGEWRIGRILKKLSLQLGGIEFHDFMFEDNKSSSQIDNMLLTQKALYVIEVKNYKGHIYGSEEQLNWTMTVKHVNKRKSKSGKVYKKTKITKHQFYNPLKQNKTHINKIRNLTNIHDNVPVINIVVFGKNATIKDVTHSERVYVLHQTELKKIITTIESQLSNIIPADKQMEIVDTLFDINITDKKRRKQHVKNLQEKYTD